MNAEQTHQSRNGERNLPAGRRLIVRFDSQQSAFTFVDLIAVIAVIAICALMIFPALGRTRTTSSSSHCQNNLKQLTAAWAMYSGDNGGWLVAAFPNYASFSKSWCMGNAASGGSPGSYQYGGADPRGITNGLLFSYVKSLSLYKCPSDSRVSLPGNPHAGQPILRSVSMNSYLAGASYGIQPSFNMLSQGGPRNPNTPVVLRENEISRPANTFVIIDEDPASINDGMFTVDMGGAIGFIDLPSRLHNNGYSISFADGHTESIKLMEQSSLNSVMGGPTPINNDWRRITNITTAPLQ